MGLRLGRGSDTSVVGSAGWGAGGLLAPSRGGAVRRGWQQRWFAAVVRAVGGAAGATEDGARMLAVCGAAAEVPLAILEESALVTDGGNGAAAGAGAGDGGGDAM